MRKQKSTSMVQRALPALAAAALVSASSFAQTAPAAKPEKAMPAPASSSSAAPTASQSNDALFKRIDTDADGALSKPELEKFDPEAAKSFDKYDTDKDAKLSLSEFDTMVKGLRGG